jgi:hypothetical protein
MVSLALRDAEIVGCNLHVRFNVQDDDGGHTATVVVSGGGVVVDIHGGSDELDAALIGKTESVLTARSVLDVIGAWDRRNRRRATQ